MKEKIRLKIDEEFENEFQKLRQLLALVKVDYKIENVERESMSGHAYDDQYLLIEYDIEEVFKRMHRSNGRKKKSLYRVMTVEEVRKMVAEKNAEEVAKKLGISRRTLYRRLEQAEKSGDKYLI